ncbi:hypothetical protein TCDM_13353 [Trypanosoma cruzi Dm28c]|uniref:Uncharacterized protein n=1 Tax=Trypanosoma cruzi Dm28c TaxID=1416333 RepID=V5ASZ2_TRYCR|nr:hypothetical protein TCDM_13353 [Trypanosoma cruzi Dm28c]
MASIVQPCFHFSTGRKRRHAVAKSFLQSTVQLLISVCACALEKQGKKEAQGGKSTQQEAQPDSSDACGTAQPQQSHTVAAHTIHKNKKKTKKHGGRVWLCVWRCGCLPALAA